MDKTVRALTLGLGGPQHDRDRRFLRRPHTLCPHGVYRAVITGYVLSSTVATTAIAKAHSHNRRHSRRHNWEPSGDVLSASSGTMASTLALPLTLPRTCTGSSVERRTGGKSILLCSSACHASIDMTATERRYEHGPQRQPRRPPHTQHLRRESNGGPMELGRN